MHIQAIAARVIDGDSAAGVRSDLAALKVEVSLASNEDAECNIASDR